MKPTDIINAFYKELGPIKDAFEIFQLSTQEAQNSTEHYVWHPGVYVWYHPDYSVLRVGRSLDNSRKRALAHIRDNTGGIMAHLGTDERTSVFLFNVKDPEKHHWVAALEIYLEKVLKPTIPAGKQG